MKRLLKRLLSLPKSIFIGLLRRPQLTIALGILFLIALIWVFGSALGLHSHESRLLAIVGVVLCWTIFLLWDRHRANQGASLLEESMKIQAAEQLQQSRPDRQEEIDAIRLEFEKALSTLKTSKLGKGRSSRNALYALPWYMIIGPSAAGKSTALRQSGLEFPSLGESGKGIKGIGGTRNCDWWFTNEAVLLDTAGRYMTEEEDKDEWLGFLNLLKKYRKSNSINGVIVAVSISDLLENHDDELTRHAQNIRMRIDELISRLGIVFPVYLLFTKCDLVDGFIQFFEDFSKAEREQLWGCSLPQHLPAQETPQARFDAEFLTLIEALGIRRLARLATVLGTNKTKIYSFPLQLKTCQERLSHFVGQLFQQNPYQENPIFRGFYFTSGTQEGTPIDRILNSVSRACGLPPLPSHVSQQQEAKSYFLKNLFQDVIFPDQMLVRPSSAVHRQRGFLRVGTFILAAVMVTFAGVGITFSYLGNKVLIESVRQNSADAMQIQSHNAQLGQSQYLDNILYLEDIRSELNQLERYQQEGIPWRLLGLYEGEKLYQPLRDVYHQHFRHLILKPTLQEIEANLNRFVTTFVRSASQQDQAYYLALFKTYLMLGDSDNVDPEFMYPNIKNLWESLLRTRYPNPDLLPEEASQAIFRQIDFFTHYLAKASAAQTTLHAGLIRNLRQYFRRVPLTQRIYGQIQQEGQETLTPFTLTTALEEHPQAPLHGEYSIPGMYTIQGWTSFFQTALISTIYASGKENWILQERRTNSGHLEAAIKELYFADYKEHWLQFLRATTIRSAETLPNIEATLENLSAQQSSLSDLLAAVVTNTGLEANPLVQIQQDDSGLLKKMKQKFQFDSISEQIPRGEPFLDPVYRQFRSLHHFIASPKGTDQSSFLGQYLAELSRAHETFQITAGSGGTEQVAYNLGRKMATGETNELTQAFVSTQRLLQTLEVKLRQALSPILLEPFRMAIGGIMRRTTVDLNNRWQREVYEPCQRTIAERYPFRERGLDASIADVTNFFNPRNGILWTFYDNTLKPFILEGRDQWVGKSSQGVGVPLSPSFLENLRYSRHLSESLFANLTNSTEVPFVLTPYPAKGPAGRFVSEIFLKIGGQSLRYRMGPQEQQQMHWPGKTSADGTILQVNVNGTWETKKFKGEWGWFHLLDGARVLPHSRDDRHFKIEWDLQTRNGQQFTVMYDLIAHSSKNPFRQNFFKNFHCVSDLG